MALGIQKELVQRQREQTSFVTGPGQANRLRIDIAHTNCAQRALHESRVLLQVCHHVEAARMQPAQPAHYDGGVSLPERSTRVSKNLTVLPAPPLPCQLGDLTRRDISAQPNQTQRFVIGAQHEIAACEEPERLPVTAQQLMLNLEIRSLAAHAACN